MFLVFFYTLVCYVCIKKEKERKKGEGSKTLFRFLSYDMSKYFALMYK